MKTIEFPKDYKQVRTVQITHQKVVRIIFKVCGKFLVMRKPEDKLSRLPGFQIRDGEILESQAKRFALKHLGINILSFEQTIGPIYFNSGTDDVDYLDIQIAVPRHWQECHRENTDLVLTYVDKEEIFSRVGHLSRLCLSEYWHS